MNANDAEQIQEWRRDYAIKLGFPISDSEAIAVLPLDLHEIERLVQMGCAPALALEIVA
jgi:hypothetical protein